MIWRIDNRPARKAYAAKKLPAGNAAKRQMPTYLYPSLACEGAPIDPEQHYGCTKKRQIFEQYRRADGAEAFTVSVAAEIACALGGVPGGWSCRCPVHDDRTPSLSLREGIAASSSGAGPAATLAPYSIRCAGSG